jgi:hypothetical protein
MSGLSHTPGKRTKGKTFRGFESRPLRQIQALNFHEFRAFFALRGLRACYLGAAGLPP